MKPSECTITDIMQACLTSRNCTEAANKLFGYPATEYIKQACKKFKIDIFYPPKVKASLPRCKHCDSEFTPTGGKSQIYCSHKCGNVAVKRDKSHTQSVEFKTKLSSSLKRYYNENEFTPKQVTRTCKFDGSIFTVAYSKKQRCSSDTNELKLQHSYNLVSIGFDVNTLGTPLSHQEYERCSDIQRKMYDKTPASLLQGADGRYHYLYKTHNLINGKFYIGVHSTRSIDDGYIGSGKRLQLAIQKYGVSNFRREIVAFFNTPEEMYQEESRVVTKQLLQSENAYNLKRGGDGGFDYINKNKLSSVYRKSS